MASTPTFGAIVIGDEILSGKRRDQHLAHLIAVLSQRGFTLGWARYLLDDRPALVRVLRETFATPDIVFSFGGIGATPDDHTRQAAAEALGLRLVRHPEAVAEIEAQFGAAAYPHRVLMAEFPEGATIVPNPVNRVAAFSVGDHHFLPGFPQMAWPMVDWLFAGRYSGLRPEFPTGERSVVVHELGESALLPLMEEVVARFPRLKLFSLPSFVADGGRRLELGVRGDVRELEAALRMIESGLGFLGCRWEPATPDRGDR